MTEEIDGEMNLIPIFREAERCIKNARIAQEDIETLSGDENLFRSCLDGCKGAKVALDEGNLDNPGSVMLRESI